MSPEGQYLVLVVDDSSTNRLVIRGFLGKEGLAVVQADSAPQVFEALGAGGVDLILMDIMMPDTDGIALCKTIKTMPEYQDIPLIFLTAMSDKSMVIQALEAGGADYLTKPVHPLELKLRVQNQLQLRSLVANLRDANAKLEELATRDPLTGLLNRRRAWELLSWELDKARRGGRATTVLMLDIDNFKQVNDTWGHAVGDRILVETAAILVDSVRSQDLVVRWGGEEFLLVLPDTDQSGGQTVASKILTAFRSRAWNLEGRGVTASIGLASSLDGKGDHTLIKQADEALYKAKEGGRDQLVVFGR